MSRAVTPAVGVVLLTVVTVALATVVGGAAIAVPEDPPPVAQIAVSADAAENSITVVHRGGDALEPSDIRLLVTVEGTALRYQPPVPFFASEGFKSGPTGPLNSGTDGGWRAGERGTFQLASTNEPVLTTGATVRVTVTTDRGVVAVGETTAT